MQFTCIQINSILFESSQVCTNVSIYAQLSENRICLKTLSRIPFTDQITENCNNLLVLTYSIFKCDVHIWSELGLMAMLLSIRVQC